MKERNEHQTFKADEIPSREISDPAVLSNDPLVSVIIITYNHEPYIAEAIEGALMQKTNFPYEVLIGEDDSSDGTREICKEYAAKYPDKIRLFLNDRKNVIYIGGQPTGRWNFINLLKKAKGKFIAICEGDDYWTDCYKLQKQVDFLENNPEYVVCSHLVENFYQDNTRKSYVFPHQSTRKETYTFEDFLYRNHINTCSVVYRWQFDKTPLPEWFSDHFTGDYSLHLLHAYQGHVKVLPEVMAKRRIHSKGIMSGSRGKYRVWRIKDRISFMHNINEYSNYGYDQIIRNLITHYQQSLINALLDENNEHDSKRIYNEIKHIMDFKPKCKYLFHLYFPDLFSASKRIYNQTRKTLDYTSEGYKLRFFR